MIYKLSIECATREIAEVIQQWANKNFYCDEIFWNAISEKKEYNEK